MYVACSISNSGALVRCSYEDGQSSGSEETSLRGITVEEAKAFFEEQLMQSGNTLNNAQTRGFATNFTPQWDRARISSGRDSMIAVDVPIVAEFAFMASRADTTEETGRFDALMLQKLIVVKDLRTNRLGSYVATIIPDKNYIKSRKNTNSMDFLNYGDYGNFSGRVIYTLPLSTVPLRINRFEGGSLTDSVSFF